MNKNECEKRTTAELITELTKLRQRVAILESTEVESKRIEAALRRHNRELVTLNTIIASLTSTLELDDVLRGIIGAAADLIPHATGTTLQILDATAGSLITEATTPKVHLASLKQLDFQVGEGVAGWALENRRPVNIPDVTADARFIPNPDAPPFLSLLVIPIVCRDKPLGTLSVESTRRAAFDDNDERLAELLARSAAIAISNAQLVAALRECI